jgi:hypothetical protein
MAWNSIQESGSCIDFSEWNSMVTVIEQGGPSGSQLSDLLASGIKYTKAYQSGQNAVPLDDALNRFYPSTLGKAVSGGLFDHVSDSSIHGAGTLTWTELATVSANALSGANIG